MKTIEELKQRLGEIRSRLTEIDTEFRGAALPDTAKQEWNTLHQERLDTEKLIGELEARTAAIAELNGNEGNREAGAHFSVPRAGVARGDDIYDLTTVRASVVDPEGMKRELQDRARRAVETLTPAHPQSKREDAQEHVRFLLDHVDDEQGTIARRMLVTGSEIYRRAFGKQIAGSPLTGEEQRALSVGTGSQGGFAVPYQLDPTVIPVSNFAINPYRAISRTESIPGLEWRGVTGTGITVSRVAESTEATDNSPTLAQPSVQVQRVQAFVPFSREIGMDWGALQSEMARLLQDGKDEEEATSFTTGNGTAPNAQGILTGATTTVAASGTASFASGDVYKVEEALPPRFRPLAQWVASKFIYNKVRQFDTAGGAQLWVPNMQLGLQNNPGSGQNAGNTGYGLIGYQANEASAMPAALTTASKIAVLGDWRYFLIVDRIGMEIEIIPHLFGAAQRPTGQRGLYAIWRNNSKVLDPAAFRVLVTG